MSSSRWLSQVLARGGYAWVDSIDIAAEASPTEGWQAYADAAGISLSKIADVAAKHFRLERASLSDANARSLRLIPGSLAREHMIFPLSDNDHHVVVATCDPTDLEAEQAAGFASGRAVILAVATPEELEAAILEAYGEPNLADTIGTDASLTDGVQVVADEIEAIGAADTEAEPVVRLTNLILREAIERGASDIHIEPVDNEGVVRYRVDGVLRRHMSFPMAALVRVVSRIKIMGQLDIADRLRPQDGRARVKVGTHFYDLRISTVPARHAEKAVLRILDQGQTAGGMEDVGFPPQELAGLKKVLKNRDGILVVTGPTGSGKTTTLYSILRDLSTDEVNIMTVEDPVEYELPGITQIQVEKRRGVTFASTLRAILRQDPDIIFVGEIRDEETAEVAVQASMTGHLVLATLHTNDSASAVQRLEDLGLDRHSIATSLRGVLAQRLVRRGCSKCAPPGNAKCKVCAGSGYRGRAPVTELMVVDEPLAERIAEGATVDEIRQFAVASGMRLMLEVGHELIEAGVTTFEEVERVLGDMDGATGGQEPLATAALAARSIGVARENHPSAPPPPRPSGARERPPPPRPKAHREAGHGGPPLILIVDDDAVNRMLARTLLEKEGFAVTEAVDGLAALQTITSGLPFSLMVLDLDMPNLGGKEVLTAVRQSQMTAQVPIVVLTGTHDEESEFELMDLGADDYIRKPLEPRRFISRVRAALRRAAAA